MRAILLASATATTLYWRRASKAVIHCGAFGLLRAWRTTDVAPTTSRERNMELPIFEMRPSRSLPPLEWGLGVRPSQAAKCQPDLKPVGSGTSARTAAAVIAPTPGIVVNRRAVSLRREATMMAVSTVAI